MGVVKKVTDICREMNLEESIEINDYKTEQLLGNKYMYLYSEIGNRFHRWYTVFM